jgi:hypothetical protein
MTDLTTHLTFVGVILLVLGALHLALPRTLQWSVELANASPLNREVSYVHCYFIGLVCLLWGLLPLTAGPSLLMPNPVVRLVLIGAVAFWACRFVAQIVVFNRHARDSKRWFAASLAGTALWLYLTLVWGAALAVHL